MAEALAIVGIVASITSLVDFGSKVYDRLKEYCDHLDEVPKAFRNIATELPLILDALHYVETENMTAGKAPSEATLAALRPVIDGCRTQVEGLDQILQKLRPLNDDR